MKYVESSKTWKKSAENIYIYIYIYKQKSEKEIFAEKGRENLQKADPFSQKALNLYAFNAYSHLIDWYFASKSRSLKILELNEMLFVKDLPIPFSWIEKEEMRQENFNAESSDKTEEICQKDKIQCETESKDSADHKYFLFTVNYIYQEIKKSLIGSEKGKISSTGKRLEKRARKLIENLMEFHSSQTCFFCKWKDGDRPDKKLYDAMRSYFSDNTKAK